MTDPQVAAPALTVVALTPPALPVVVLMGLGMIGPGSLRSDHRGGAAGSEGRVLPPTALMAQTVHRLPRAPRQMTSPRAPRQMTSTGCPQPMAESRGITTATRLRHQTCRPRKACAGVRCGAPGVAEPVKAEPVEAKPVAPAQPAVRRAEAGR
jgi:hypothetical protein